MVAKKIGEIRKKNKIPIIVGGTGLYFKALTQGLVKIPDIPLSFRNEIRFLQKKIGQKNFYKKLINLDPLIKKFIDSNDVQRSIRAYEIKKYTKISMINWFKNTKTIYNKNEFKKFYIDYPRVDLLKKITNRVNLMFKKGALKEVKKFNSIKIAKDSSVNKVIGIQEIRKYLNGELTLNETKDRIVIKTRQYAKRQKTWAKGQMHGWQKIDPQKLTLLLKKIK